MDNSIYDKIIEIALADNISKDRKLTELSSLDTGMHCAVLRKRGVMERESKVRREITSKFLECCKEVGDGKIVFSTYVFNLKKGEYQIIKMKEAHKIYKNKYGVDYPYGQKVM